MTVDLEGCAADLSEVARGPRGVLGHLGDDSVATEYPGDDVVQHVVEGIVPRGYDAKDAIWNVLHVGRLVRHHGANGAVLGAKPFFSIEVDTSDFLTSSHDLPKEGVNLGLAGVAGADTCDLLDVFNDVLLDGPQHLASLCVSGVHPLRLSFPRPRTKGAHVCGGHGRDVPEPLIGGGVVALEAAGSLLVDEVYHLGRCRGRLDAVVVGLGRR